MKVFNKIIQSDAEPSRNNIWFKDKKLWFHNNNGWEALTDEVGKPADLTGYLKEGDLTKYLNDGGYLKDSDIAQNVPGDYKIPGLFPLTSDGMKQMLVKSPSRLQFYVQNTPITEVGLDTKPLEQFFQSEYDTKFNRISVNLPTAEGIDPDWVPDAFQYMIGKNNLLVSMGFLHEMLARMLSGNGNTISWKYLSFADFDNEEESLRPYTGKPIDWDSSGVDNCTITQSAYYFDGTRDMSSTATNIVQEKGLYTVINDFRDTILGEDGKLKSGLIGLSPDKVPVKAGAGVTVSKSDSDITIDIKDYDKLAKVAILNVGTTDEVKTHNQAQIPTDKTTFFVQIENGIGVAKFTTTGGSAVVTTGEGTRIKYNIGPGYSCSKDTEYFEVTDLVYTMPDIALDTLDSTTNMASLLTDEQADKMFKCSYIKFNLKKMSGEHVLGTLPITCSCSSLGFSEKVFQTPTLSIGNTDFTNIKITVKKMTPEGGTEEHWYAVLETV